MLLPKNLFFKFLCTPIDLKQKTKAIYLVRSYPLLQLITDMTRPTKRIEMDELLTRFENLKQMAGIRFNKDVVRQLNETSLSSPTSSRKFADTNDYLMKLDLIS